MCTITTKTESYKDAETLRRMYWDEEMSLRKIAEYFGVGNGTIQSWMNKNNIKTRTKREAARNRAKHENTPIILDENGYEIMHSRYGDEHDRVPLHRLLAVVEYGFSAVKGKHVHHKNHLSWGNWGDNIDLMTPSEHATHHAKQRAKQE